jgi:hypothetical protein
LNTIRRAMEASSFGREVFWPILQMAS